MDARHGAKPNPAPSAASIVQYGLTRRERVLIARRDDRSMLRAFHAVYDRAFVDEIIALCDKFLAKHGTWEEQNGDLR